MSDGDPACVKRGSKMYRMISRVKGVVGLVIVMSIAVPTVSAPLVLYPIQIGAETARSHQGVPTVVAANVRKVPGGVSERFHSTETRSHGGDI